MNTERFFTAILFFTTIFLSVFSAKSQEISDTPDPADFFPLYQCKPWLR